METVTTVPVCPIDVVMTAGAAALLKLGAFHQDFDKLEKNSRKRKGKKPIFVQTKLEDSVVSTSEEEFHDEFLDHLSVVCF
jgi:hypothetical protein